MSKRHLSQQQQQRIQQRRQNHAQLQEGLVISNTGKTAVVQQNSNNQLYICHQRANLGQVVAGDYVMFALKDQHHGVIENRLERRSLLSRPGFRGVIKPIAANVDQLLVVIAPTPGIDLALLDRSLCYCEWQQIDAIIVFNKYELLSYDEQKHYQQLADSYRHMGYIWLETSTYQPTGLDNLAAYCADKTSVFLGNSGVGKSSLTQALIPDISIRTQTLSAATGLGQHTTSQATLYPLPHGGQLIDIAGIRSLNLAEFSIDQPDRYWRDFHPFLGHCRFHNCTHIHEPECAIKDAVFTHQIALHRYQHYVQAYTERHKA